MPRIKFRSSEGGEWQPLPDAPYLFQIDEVELDTSKAGNQQLKISAHVEGGEYDQKKVTIWRVLTPKSGWKIELLLEATGAEFTKEESGETNPETGKPLYDYDFDTDDLVGRSFVADVSTREYQGKVNNDFNNERAPEGAEEEEAPEEQEAAPANGAAEEKPAAAKPAASAGGQRRRRLRQ